jgi:dTMP kinase
MLYDWCKEQFPEREVLLTKEPGGTDLGKLIREALLSTDCEPRIQALLFAADRAIHVQKIRPILEKGGIVICDRYTDSSVAYQHGGSGLDRNYIDTLNLHSSQQLKPDLTVLLQLHPVIARERAIQRGILDIYESKGLDFHQRVHDTYKMLAEQEPYRFVCINAEQPIMTIFEEIKQAFCTKLAELNNSYLSGMYAFNLAYCDPYGVTTYHDLFVLDEMTKDGDYMFDLDHTALIPTDIASDIFYQINEGRATSNYWGNSTQIGWFLNILYQYEDSFVAHLEMELRTRLELPMSQFHLFPSNIYVHYYDQYSQGMSIEEIADDIIEYHSKTSLLPVYE